MKDCTCLNCQKRFRTQNYAVGKFCSKKCWGAFNGRKNKGKKYLRHIENYVGNQTSFRKGERASVQTEFKKGQRVSPRTEFKLGQLPWNTGIPHSIDVIAKLKNAKIGVFVREKNPNWKGGVTPFNRALRGTAKYLEWRKKVFERDNYTCQLCGQRGGELQADHIQPFSKFPELRHELNNGRTLCVPCHRKTPTWGNKLIYARN